MGRDNTIMHLVSQGKTFIISMGGIKVITTEYSYVQLPIVT